VEYKAEAFDMFEALMRDLYLSVARFAFRAQIAPPEPAPPPPPLFYGPPAHAEEPVEASYGGEEAPAPEPAPAPRPRSSLGINPYAAVPPSARQLRTNREEPAGAAKPAAQAAVGRNDPCPCGSGKKYKNCHGRG
jgi:preprotein translocase subunit SecA